MVLLGSGCYDDRVLGTGVWVLAGCGGCSLFSSSRGAFLRLGRLFMATLFVLDEDLAQQLSWTGNLVARLQLQRTTLIFRLVTTDKHNSLTLVVFFISPPLH